MTSPHIPNTCIWGTGEEPSHVNLHVNVTARISFPVLVQDSFSHLRSRF